MHRSTCIGGILDCYWYDNHIFSNLCITISEIMAHLHSRLILRLSRGGAVSGPSVPSPERAGDFSSQQQPGFEPGWRIALVGCILAGVNNIYNTTCVIVWCFTVQGGRREGTGGS